MGIDLVRLKRKRLLRQLLLNIGKEIVIAALKISQQNHTTD